MTSKATKRKYVIKEVLDDFVLPEKNQKIVRVMTSCGNNLHEVCDAANNKFLVSMPTKFRRNVWIKKNDYIMVTPIEEGDKVKAEITAILYKEQIKYIKENGLWPQSFTDSKTEKKCDNSPIDSDMLPPSYSDSDQSDDDCISNPNRPALRKDNSDNEDD